MQQNERVFNFSAGPSMLPRQVLEQCALDMLSYNGTGMSVMEMSHRSTEFIAIADQAVKLFRQVMNIPENYKILFMQGGASAQFSAIPLNFCKNGRADYIKSGNFSALAAQEGAKFTSVHIAASGENENYRRIPSQDELDLTPNSDYLHICFNNTVFGTRFPYIPQTNGSPLVADISSCILSEPIDITKFGMVYAGVQKNIAPSPMAVVILREDLVSEPSAQTPAIMSYKNAVKADSMYNTPNCWSIYVTKLVLEHVLSMGGTSAMKKINEEKASLLYDLIDSSDFYINQVEKQDRSPSNVIFKTRSEDLDSKFVSQATKAGLVNLKGHRAVKGMRASIYNAMPIEGVYALAQFMKSFENQNR